MKHRGRRLISLTLVLSLTLSLLLTACGGESTAATMRLIKTEGTVNVDDAHGKSVKPMENLGLFSGYALTTRAASYGWISMDDTKLAKMDAQSHVDIRKDGKLLELNVRSGNLFFNVTEPLKVDETMNIRTSTMMVGIRGTCGWVEVEGENLMRIYLLRGKVECSVLGEDGSVMASETITAGQTVKMIMENGEAVITVAEFDTSSTPDFVTEALEHPEDWSGPADAAKESAAGAEGSGGIQTGAEDSGETQAGAEDSGETQSGAVSADGTAPAIDDSEIADDIHVRLEGDTLYFSGTGTVHYEDYNGYTPVNVVVEEGIIGIGDDAFKGCRNLESIALPDGLKSIGYSAFSYCTSLTSVTLPDSLKNVDGNAFYSCGLTSIALPDSIESIGGHVFDSCKSLTSVTLPDGLKSISDHAFSHCENLTSVTLPDSVESIGQFAFSHCKSLPSITLPDSVESSGEGVFDRCSRLEEVTLGAGLTELNTLYFYKYDVLTKIKAPSSIREVVVESGMDLSLFEWY